MVFYLLNVSDLSVFYNFFKRLIYCSEMYKCLGVHEVSIRTVPDTSLHETSGLIYAIEVYCVEDNIYA